MLHCICSHPTFSYQDICYVSSLIWHPTTSWTSLTHQQLDEKYFQLMNPNNVQWIICFETQLNQKLLAVPLHTVWKHIHDPTSSPFYYSQINCYIVRYTWIIWDPTLGRSHKGKQSYKKNKATYDFTFLQQIPFLLIINFAFTLLWDEIFPCCTFYHADCSWRGVQQIPCKNPFLSEICFPVQRLKMRLLALNDWWKRFLKMALKI